MNQSFDVFRNDKDGLMWRETASSLIEAKATVKRLSMCESGDFVILDQETQEQTLIKPELVAKTGAFMASSAAAPPPARPPAWS